MQQPGRERVSTESAKAPTTGPGADSDMDPPDIDEDTARKVLEPGYHEIGESVEYGDLLLRKVEEQRSDGHVEREYYELIDDEAGEATGERLGAHHYAVNEYHDFRDDLEELWWTVH